eukprot:c24801_g2_i4 orf=100-354(-)
MEKDINTIKSSLMPKEQRQQEAPLELSYVLPMRHQHHYTINRSSYKWKRNGRRPSRTHGLASLYQTLHNKLQAAGVRPLDPTKT